MTQGIFLVDADTHRWRRPKSKKEIKEYAARDLNSVIAQATSWHGNEFDGPVPLMPLGTVVTFTGPDPETDRRFYGNIIRTKNGVSIK